MKFSFAVLFFSFCLISVDSEGLSNTVRIPEEEEDGIWSICGTPQNGRYLNDLTGSSVSICADGSYMITGSHTGAVLYMYDNGIFDWVLAYDFSEDLLPNRQYYHYRAVLSDDCSKVVIGAPGNDEKGYDAGSVQVFSKEDVRIIEETEEEVWVEQQALFGNRFEDLFGYAVDVSEDGQYVIVGAPGADYVEVFELRSNGLQWDLVNTLKGTSKGDQFGHSVAISGSGERAIMGAPLGGQLGFNGYVRIVNLLDLSFVKTISGKTAGAQVGEAVDISQDGSTVAFSSAVNGHVIVFAFNEMAQDWQKVGVSICVEEEAFGSDVSLSGDGELVAIGAPLNNHYGPRSGKAYVYEKQEEWAQMGLEKFGTTAFDSCGTAVSISSDKKRWMMGCPERDDNGKDKGQATVYCSENPAFATQSPSLVPSHLPSHMPTATPSLPPTFQPSSSPTYMPSAGPSSMPSRRPTSKPSQKPSLSPTHEPTSKPSGKPSMFPTLIPTRMPTSKPSSSPTSKPTTCYYVCE